MNKYVIREAPLLYYDGVPGYKAGEWPGIRPNKFENTRKMIQPISNDIFNFSKTESLNLNRRKLLGLRHSEELKFKPSIKIVNFIEERKQKPIIPTEPQGIRFFPKKYYFEKINEYHDFKEEEHNKLIRHNQFMNRIKPNTFRSTNLKSGYPKEFYDNISRNRLLGVSFTKETFDSFQKNDTLPKLKNTNEFLENNKNMLKALEEQKMYILKNKNEIRKKDINYVESLGNWEIENQKKTE